LNSEIEENGYNVRTAWINPSKLYHDYPPHELLYHAIYIVVRVRASISWREWCYITEWRKKV